MAFDLPDDLIKQIQISTRAQAGLSDYDPKRASEFPGLPSLSEYVASFDPSPPYLRCKHCKGRLLRGVQSLFCVYCGRSNDVAFPDPISFKDTFGYSWLLQSLHLDGSEMVEQPTEKNEMKRGKSTLKDKIPLSDLLNLKISWPVESDKPGIDVINKKMEEKNNSIWSAGVELDDFFLESKREKGTNMFELPVVSSQVKTEDTKPVATHDNLSLFQNVQPSEPTISSSEGKAIEFSGWQADFQSADTGHLHDTSLSFGTSVGSSVDLSSHIDSVFGSVKDFKGDSAASSVRVNQSSDDFGNNNSEVVSTGNTKDTQTKDNSGNPSAVDLSAHLDSVFGPGIESKDENAPSSAFVTSDDLFNNNSEKFTEVGIFDSTRNKEYTQTQDSFTNPSTSSDWFGADEWQTKNINSIHTGTTSRDDDFDEWNDFTGSSSAQVVYRSPGTEGDTQSAASQEKHSELNMFSFDNKLDSRDFNTFSEPDLFTGLSNRNNVSGELSSTLSVAPSSDRMVDAISVPDDAAGDGVANIDILSSSTQPKENIQTLISQMHDLSFMLENDLKIPSKSDNSFP